MISQPNSQFIICQVEDEQSSVLIWLEDEIIWLSLKQNKKKTFIKERLYEKTYPQLHR
jgi:hypothetical protein